MDDLTRNEPLKEVSERSPGWSAAEPGVDKPKEWEPLERVTELEPVSVARCGGSSSAGPISPRVTLHRALTFRRRFGT